MEGKILVDIYLQRVPLWVLNYRGDSSVGKESTCNAGDPSLIPELERSTGKGIGYPLQYSWASLVAHLVKSPPAIWETWVRSLGWKDPLVKGKATHSSILAWRIPWTVCVVHGVSKSQTRLSDFHTHWTFQIVLLETPLLDRELLTSSSPLPTEKGENAPSASTALPPRLRAPTAKTQVSL